MISTRPGFLLALTLSSVFACSYDYSRFEANVGGAPFTETNANGGTGLSTTEDYGQGGSVGGSSAVTTQSCANVDLQNDHDNCGVCGHACLDALVCLAGVCSCQIDDQCSSVIDRKAFCSKSRCNCGGTQCLENQVCELNASKFVCYSPLP